MKTYYNDTVLLSVLTETDLKGYLENNFYSHLLVLKSCLETIIYTYFININY